MFCFPNSDHVIFPREFPFCLFINYITYIRTWVHVHKTTVERNSSLGYQEKWENKTYKLKGLFDVLNQFLRGGVKTKLLRLQ